MPDISMCMNEECKLAPTCRRSPKSGTVPTPNWQSWAAFEPDADGTCDVYWEKGVFDE